MRAIAAKQSAIVIGSGVVGTSVAFALAEIGIAVKILDNNAAPFQGVSKAGFGSLTPFSDPFYKGETRAIAAESVQIYRTTWLNKIRRLSGLDVHLQDSGLLQICANTKDVKDAEFACAELASAGFGAKVLSRRETRRLEPNLTADLQGALWLDEPWVDIDQYFRALDSTIRQHNKIDIHNNVRVISIENHPDSVAVRCESGRRFRADLLVVCTGLGTPQIENAPKFEIRWMRGDAIALYSSFSQRPLLSRHIYLHDGFITPRANQRLLLGATYINDHRAARSNEPPSNRHIELSQFDHLISANERILPAIRRCEVGEVWRGWRPTPRDSKPILGVKSPQANVVHAIGFIGLGITMAPAVALMVARYAKTRDASVFPKIFSPDRFK